MTSHKDILEKGGKASGVSASLAEKAGISVDANTVWGWIRNDSIPGHYWRAFERANLATVSELAAYAEQKRLADKPTEAA